MVAADSARSVLLFTKQRRLGDQTPAFNAGFPDVTTHRKGGPTPSNVAR